MRLVLLVQISFFSLSSSITLGQRRYDSSYKPELSSMDSTGTFFLYSLILSLVGIILVKLSGWTNNNGKPSNNFESLSGTIGVISLGCAVICLMPLIALLDLILSFILQICIVGTVIFFLCVLIYSKLNKPSKPIKEYKLTNPEPIRKKTDTADVGFQLPKQEPKRLFLPPNFRTYFPPEIIQANKDNIREVPEENHTLFELPNSLSEGVHTKVVFRVEIAFNQARYRIKYLRVRLLNDNGRATIPIVISPIEAEFLLSHIGKPVTFEKIKIREFIKADGEVLFFYSYVFKDILSSDFQ